MRRILFVILLLGNASLSFAQQIDYKGFPQWSWGRKDSTEYYLYTPSDPQNDRKYPIVLVLHGCCGEDYHATLRNAVDPLVRVWHNFGENTQRIPAYIVSPKTKRGWMNHAENLKTVMDSLIAHHRGDPERVYITGFSMGASGTWQYLEKYPDFFAAAIPVGMNYTGRDPDNIKHIPVWTLRGETDWWAKNLGAHVADFRQRNGWIRDSSQWVTGVNPQFTTFPGLGHGVMWAAVSTYDLPAWAFSKVNDGNKYPVAFFISPPYKAQTREGTEVTVHLNASDPDGTITKVMFSVNGRPIGTISSEPFRISFTSGRGEQKIEATVYDDKGKTTLASTMVRTDVPVKIVTASLPAARCGEFYYATIHGEGNGMHRFSLTEKFPLPPGIQLTTNGVLSGIPVKAGRYPLIIRMKDEDNEVSEKKLTLVIGKKNKHIVLITDAQNFRGESLPVTIVRKGTLPFFDRGDDEISLSDVPEKYDGLTLIQTNLNDTTHLNVPYLSFHADEPVTVYVAYEKLDNLFTSTTPAWLSVFKKVNTKQIVAQYFYYDVYAKNFPAGKITLADAEEKKNGVNTNYFVMVEKQR